MTGERTTEGALLKTALHSRHLDAGARMVDFGGWDMPIQYRGIRAEHLAVRSGVGVFDLSHMGRLYVRGADALRLVPWLTTNHAGRLAPARAQYSLACRERGPNLGGLILYHTRHPPRLAVNTSN